jgi:Protein of unknown function (DUF1194)
MRRTGSIGVRFLLLSLLLLSPAAEAFAETVDLALVLAVDSSESIDNEEVKLQREGYIAAIKDPGILHAIQKGKHGKIALAYFEWADVNTQTLLIDWITVSDEASAVAFGERLKSSPILDGHFTSISSAIGYAMTLLDNNPYKTKRRVIDVSGDGRNNNGPPLAQMQAEAIKRKITINGLPIVNDRDRQYSGLPPDDIERYYRKNVIAGKDAFIVVARNFHDFERAIIRKLMREIVEIDPHHSYADAQRP